MKKGLVAKIVLGIILYIVIGIIYWHYGTLAIPEIKLSTGADYIVVLSWPLLFLLDLIGYLFY